MTLTDKQLNAILTKVQQLTMIDMSDFETREQYMELQARANTITEALRQLKAEIKDVDVDTAKALAKDFVAKYKNS